MHELKGQPNTILQGLSTRESVLRLILADDEPNWSVKQNTVETLTRGRINYLKAKLIQYLI